MLSPRNRLALKGPATLTSEAPSADVSSAVTQERSTSGRRSKVEFLVATFTSIPNLQYYFWKSSRQGSEFAHKSAPTKRYAASRTWRLCSLVLQRVAQKSIRFGLLGSRRPRFLTRAALLGSSVRGYCLRVCASYLEIPAVLRVLTQGILHASHFRWAALARKSDRPSMRYHLVWGTSVIRYRSDCVGDGRHRVSFRHAHQKPHARLMAALGGTHGCGEPNPGQLQGRGHGRGCPCRGRGT